MRQGQKAAPAWNPSDFRSLFLRLLCLFAAIPVLAASVAFRPGLPRLTFSYPRLTFPSFNPVHLRS